MIGFWIIILLFYVMFGILFGNIVTAMIIEFPDFNKSHLYKILKPLFFVLWPLDIIVIVLCIIKMFNNLTR